MIIKGNLNKQAILEELIKESDNIKISTGYFSVTAFELLKESILLFEKSGSKFEIILGADTDVRQINLLNNIIDNKDMDEQEFMDAYFSDMKELSIETLTSLKRMIQKSMLEFKIGISDMGIYHPKNYIFKQKDGLLSITGSMNFSFNGIMKNFESVTYFNNYNDEHTLEYNKEFDEIWNTKIGNVYACFINEIIITNINNIIDDKKIYSKKVEDNNIVLRDYQLECIEGLIKSDMNGFLELATGTGKTFTTIYALKKYMDNGYRVCHIVVPYKHLATQWNKEIEFVFGTNAHIIQMHSENENWKSQLEPLGYLRNNKYVFLIFVSNTYFNNLNYLKFSTKKDDILIVDEAHNLTIDNIDKLSILNYNHRVGLSASPHNYLDQQRTDLLFEYFDKYHKKFDLKDAIEREYLTKYNYYPYLINLSSDEAKFYNELRQKYIKGNKKDLSLITEMDEILSKAYKKIDTFISIIKRNGLDHSLIYCQQGKTKSSNITYIEYTAEKIHEVIDGIQLEKITANEKVSEREKIIDNFNKGETNAILAIRCLDEGYDIPSVRDAYILNSTRNPKEYIQRRGRLLRNYEGKDISNIYDFILAIDDTIIDSETIRFDEYSRLANNQNDVIYFKENNNWEVVDDE